MGERDDDVAARAGRFFTKDWGAKPFRCFFKGRGIPIYADGQMPFMKWKQRELETQFGYLQTKVAQKMTEQRVVGIMFFSDINNVTKVKDDMTEGQVSELV